MVSFVFVVLVVESVESASIVRFLGFEFAAFALVFELFLRPLLSGF